MSVSLSQRVMHISPSVTLNLNAEVAHLKNQGIQVISLGAGEPDFPTPPHIADAAIQAIRDHQTRYTHICGILPLREAICTHIRTQKNLTYSSDEILVGAGAKQVLYEALQAVIDPGDDVLLPAPYWVSYPEMIRLAGGNPIIIPPGNSFLPTLSQLKKAVTDRTKALIINTPNNPSGTVWTSALLEDVMRLAKAHNFLVISDEIYKNLVYDDAVHVSPAVLSDDARSRTVMISGLSKSYAMTGWRVGYAAGPKHLIAAMAALQSHASGSINTPAQYAALAALTSSQSCVPEMKNVFSRRRELLLNLLRQEDLLPAFIPQGAFYLLLNIRPYLGKSLQNVVIDNDVTFAQQLLSVFRVAALPGASFGMDGHIRLSYAADELSITAAVRNIGMMIRALQ